MPCADTRTPPRQAEPDTPPQEGNCWVRRGVGGASGCTPPRQAEPDTPPQEGNCQPPEEGNCRVQIRGHHPVRRSLTPLRRRGIPPRQAELDTPPQEGNCRLHRRGMIRCYWRGPSRNTLTRRRMLASTCWFSNTVPQMGCPVCDLTGSVSSGSGSSTHSVAYLSAGY